MRSVHQATSGVRVVHGSGKGLFPPLSPPLPPPTDSINCLLLQSFKGHMRCGHKASFESDVCASQFLYTPETQVQTPQQSVSVNGKDSSSGSGSSSGIVRVGRMGFGRLFVAKKGGERWEGSKGGLHRRWHGRAQLSPRLTGIGCYFRISRWAVFGRTERPPRSWSRNRCSSK